ncbi:MAG TPA: hypothetical protein VGD98_24745 [Ktedonobacteraceae bacterium]
MSQNQPPQNYPGYQHNLAGAQGYPGYQYTFDTLAPVLPAIQATDYPGYNQTPVEPIILPAPQPPQPRHIGRSVLIAFLTLLLIVGGGAGYSFYNNHQNSIHAQATADAHARATAHAQASATAVTLTYPFSNHLLLDDPLTNPSHVSQYGWVNYTPSCFFFNQVYNASVETTNTYATCPAEQTYFYDFTFQVQMTIQQGNATSRGGLIFRALADNAEFYLLFVDAQGQYQLLVSLHPNLSSGYVLRTGLIPGFARGLNQQNTIGVVVRGQQISFYANKKLVTRVTDKTYISGQIGVVSSSGSSPTNITYTHALVWQL